MNHRVHDRLEERLCAVLGEVLAGGRLARPDVHVAHGEGERLRDLAVDWPRDFLRVDLARRAIRALVADGGNGGV